MDADEGLIEAARLFKVLGNESRLGLLRLIGDAECSVGALVEATGLSQPLVSQHLKTLRDAGLVVATRRGKAVGYRLADLHVSHVIADALAHVREPAAEESADPTEPHTKESS
ncbi:ArsR/SmtB family transcription factor [Mycetocola reblochoni]|uniref:Transcriptional regulator, ArsR family n=2 Tax=Mycetocola reblochoni TaxID=331618 RepID=A0A1R4IH32_9MICO|nr:metalloregulator ArsR/SmtB family transcription factor [Mycetocola reblochoni]RLP69682.1 ArsR family transcriptional regulator [Mycetocola reblochoni]SJN19192.1 transcriptional regulator, ArsR family [Mycetocola reblochoni REB411]